MAEWKVDNLEWVIEGQLARYCRPGRYDGGDDKNVSADRVDDWILHLLDNGVESVICLLDDEHLNCYGEIPGGLLNYYEANGLEVVNVAVQNGVRMSNELKERALRAFNSLPKPVLVHCNKGRTRTGRCVDYIEEAVS